MQATFPGGQTIQAYGLSGYISVDDHSSPGWGLYLDEDWRRQEVPDGSRFVDWPDMKLPTDEADAFDAFVEVWRRAGEGEVVEIACDGGTGRTGTALACCAVQAGMIPEEALAWVRDTYSSYAVETNDQEQLVIRFAAWLGRNRLNIHRQDST